VHFDALDEATQDLERFGLCARIGKRGLQVRDLFSVELGKVGMEPWCWGGCVGNLRLERGLALFQLVELVLLQGEGQFSRVPTPIDLSVEFLDELGNEVGVHEVVLEGVKDEALKYASSNTPAITAGALSTSSAAAEIVPARRRQRRAICATMGQARQQMLGAAVQPEFTLTRLLNAAAVPDTSKSALNTVKQLIFHDPQLGHVLRDPLALGIDSSEALACVRVLDVALLVPNEPPDIERISEDTRAPERMAADGGVGPGTAFRSGDVVGIQRMRDSAGRLAGGKGLKNATHNDRLSLVNGAAAMDRLAAGINFADDIVAVAKATARAPLPDAAFETASNLLAQVAQEKCVHRSHEGDQIQRPREKVEAEGADTIDLSLITDGLIAEREQGITNDVAYRNFKREGAYSSSQVRPGKCRTFAISLRTGDGDA